MRKRTSWPPLGVVVGEPLPPWISDTRSPSQGDMRLHRHIETGTILDMHRLGAAW